MFKALVQIVFLNLPKVSLMENVNDYWLLLLPIFVLITIFIACHLHVPCQVISSEYSNIHVEQLLHSHTWRKWMCQAWSKVDGVDGNQTG